MKDEYQYKAEDLERYHSGKMSEQEMHALEKAALEDPFLADALEGYVYATNAAGDIEELKERIGEIKKKRKVFFLATRQSLWKVAAILVVIIGAGIITYQLNFNSKGPVAKNENNFKTMAPVSPITSESNDSVSAAPGKNDLVLNQPKQKENTNVIPEAEKRYDAVKEKTSPVTSTNLPSKPGYNQPKQQPASPVNSAPVTAMKGRGKETFARDSTDRSYKSNDSLTNTTASALNKRNANPVAMNDEKKVTEEHDKNLREVTTSSYDIKKEKKQNTVSNAMQERVPGYQATPSTLSDGLKGYDQYVHNNIRVPKNDSGQNYKGKVVLSFEVNKNGKPKKIKVDQSLCEECDAEAIRLLQQGPKWKYVKGRNVVTIEF